MQTLTLDITGVSCGGCTGNVQRALSQIDGVSQAEVTLRPGVATVVTDPARVTPAQIEAAITLLGYPAHARPGQAVTG
jgi:copper chaperone